MRNRATLLAIVLTAVCCLATFAPGQSRRPPNIPKPPVPSTPTPPPPPYVNVTKADGTVLKGHLVASDPASISVRPPASPGKPENEPLVLKWAEVAKVSNGLTRQKVLTQWQAEKKDKLCTDCKGDGTIVCATCKGTQHDPAKLAKDCAECKGELLVDCKAPKCDHGQLPCPDRCLKLTDPGWFMKDGKKWRRFPQKGGYFEASEAHVGEIVVMKDGRGATEPCPTCGKTGKIDCGICHGSGKVPCATCSKNDAAPKCPDCDKGRQPCKTCEGTGMKKLGA